MLSAIRRLKPDPENWPAWLRAELAALAEDCAQLPPEEVARARRARLSPRARAYFAEQATRAIIAHRLLREARRE